MMIIMQDVMERYEGKYTCMYVCNLYVNTEMERKHYCTGMGVSFSSLSNKPTWSTLAHRDPSNILGEDIEVEGLPCKGHLGGQTLIECPAEGVVQGILEHLSTWMQEYWMEGMVKANGKWRYICLVIKQRIK